MTCSSTHTECIVMFPLQQWLHECTTMLHYIYIAYLFKFSLLSLPSGNLYNISPWNYKCIPGFSATALHVLIHHNLLNFIKPKIPVQLYVSHKFSHNIFFFILYLLQLLFSLCSKTVSMFSPGLVTDLYLDKAQNWDTVALHWHIHRKYGYYSTFHKA